MIILAFGLYDGYNQYSPYSVCIGLCLFFGPLGVAAPLGLLSCPPFRLCLSFGRCSLIQLVNKALLCCIIPFSIFVHIPKFLSRTVGQKYHNEFPAVFHDMALPFCSRYLKHSCLRMSGHFWHGFHPGIEEYHISLMLDNSLNWSRSYILRHHTCAERYQQFAIDTAA